jgi:branched-chain amino acid aminotransferase
MANISSHIWIADGIVPSEQAQLHVASSAVLYGLSVYTVFPIIKTPHGFYIFSLDEHLKRLQNSAKLIGIACPNICEEKSRFVHVVEELLRNNDTSWDRIFVRATIHVDELVPGTRSRGLHTILSAFLYEAKPIVPQNGMRLKTSVWRRNPDFALPSRAKVNGAYVNSVLAKQDAIDSGYDDAIFLDMDGHVCEISAANIFLVRGDTLITPDVSSDILEGINRKTLIEIAASEGKQVIERKIDLSELYIADEVFVCGTSAFVAGVTEIDKRTIS